MNERILPLPLAEKNTGVGKVLRRLVPLCMLLYVVAYIDRTNVGFAALAMNQELGLNAAMFGLANTAYYFGYAAFQVPSNIMLERTGAQKWIPRIMIIWGLVSAATIFATGPYVLYVMRLLLGLAEAGIMPGILFYLGLWIPRAYRARANAIFLAALPVSLMIGSPLSALIMQMNGTLGLSGWRWLLLVEAAPAVVLGLFVQRLLPARPEDANWLTEIEKRELRQQLTDEHTTSVESQPAQSRAQLWREILSLRVMLLSVTYFCLAASLNMLAVWSPQIVKELLGSESRLLLVGFVSAIPPLASLIVMPFITASSDRSGDRTWHSAGLFALGAFGWALAATAPTAWLRLFGLALSSVGTYAAFAIFFALVSQLLSRAGQAAGIATVSSLGLVSTMLSPVIVGVLRDLTDNFNAGLWYTAVLLIAGCGVIVTLRPSGPNGVPAFP